eukprot:c25326_g2_i3 orf=707-1060(+)
MCSSHHFESPALHSSNGLVSHTRTCLEKNKTNSIFASESFCAMREQSGRRNKIPFRDREGEQGRRGGGLLKYCVETALHARQTAKLEIKAKYRMELKLNMPAFSETWFPTSKVHCSQ